jgi:adenylyl-sulfate kinase
VSPISADARERLLGQHALTIWLTGLSGSGKSSIAQELERRLHAQGRHVYALDGDNLRFGLNRDLTFSREDRSENIRRAAEVARLFNDAGTIVLVPIISPFREDRDRARAIIGADRFVEVYLSTPLAVCEARDAKGLYKKARAGEIAEFTGISSPY